MNSSRIVQILRKLNTKERTRFHEYVFSPFFNKNKRLQLLCDLLLKHAPDFKSKQLGRQTLHQKIFKTKAYKVTQINNLISDLLKLLYSYLALVNYEAKPALGKNFLLEELLRKDIHQDVERVARAYEKIQQATPLANHSFYLEEYQRYDKLDRFFFTKSVRTYDENLQLKNDHLDLYYFGNKFRIACDMASRNIVTNAQYQCHFLDDLITHFESDHELLHQVPALQIYYKILKMIQEHNVETHYQELKTLVQNNVAIFPQEELRILYTYLLNYGIKKINSGQSEYYGEVLDVYKLLVKDEIIFKNGHLPHWTFKNICTLGIRLKDFDWTNNFIQQYAHTILEVDRNNAVVYNLAALYYARKDYKAALHQLHDVEFTDDNYHLGAKGIQLKSYYELSEMEALYALVEAFKKFVRRSRQLSDYLKSSTLNFARMTKRLAQLAESKGSLGKREWETKRLELLEKIKGLESVANKDWLVEGVVQLGSN
ncbi:MAG: hypothetical protein AB8F74_03525 [Saprospiraceae bacterium]